LIEIVDRKKDKLENLGFSAEKENFFWKLKLIILAFLIKMLSWTKTTGGD